MATLRSRPRENSTRMSMAAHGTPYHDAQSRKKRLSRWPIFYAVLIAGLISKVSWSWRWLQSGAAVETLLLVLGESNGTRILSIAPTYALISIVNLVYAVSSTSWLLYWLFTVACWPFVCLTCLYEFESIANFTRGRLRSLLKHLQFVHDKIAVFNIPALEIDTEVSGLFVLRGLTVSLSSLTFFAHGIELGIKMSEDIELAIYVDEVTISLFRRIEIGDCYANLKGGKLEMTFGDLDDKSPNVDSDADSVFDADTPLLRAATGKDDKLKDDKLKNDKLKPSRPSNVKRLTGGRKVRDSSVRASLESLERLLPDDEQAVKTFNDTLAHISSTSTISQCQREVEDQLHQNATSDVTEFNEKDMRAAVCARMHARPSVPHPPKRSVKVTTLQRLSAPWLRRFLHRLPLLLRLLLGPLAYLHSISIASITSAGSGAWLREIIRTQIFKHYVDENAELRRLAKRMETWLAGAHFVLQLTDIEASAQVPIDPTYDIKTSLRFDDVIAYRALLKTYTVTQALRLGGATATFTIPSFLLPHHEHLVPPRPSPQDITLQVEEVEQADGLPRTAQAQKELEKTVKDEASIAMSVHASLPVSLDQDLLNFVAAFVKAAKVIEIEKMADDEVLTEDDTTETESIPESSTPTTKKKFATLVQSVKQTTREGVKATREGMKVAFVGGVINDRWIAKMVGKVAAKLEGAQGDAGYSGGIPIPLEPYRSGFNTDTDSKLLP